MTEEQATLVIRRLEELTDCVNRNTSIFTRVLDSLTEQTKAINKYLSSLEQTRMAITRKK